MSRVAGSAFPRITRPPAVNRFFGGGPAHEEPHALGGASVIPLRTALLPRPTMGGKPDGGADLIVVDIDRYEGSRP